MGSSLGPHENYSVHPASPLENVPIGLDLLDSYITTPEQHLLIKVSRYSFQQVYGTWYDKTENITDKKLKTVPAEALIPP